MDAKLQAVFESLQSHLYSRFEYHYWQKTSEKPTAASFAPARAYALQLLDVFDGNAAFELGTSYHNPALNDVMVCRCLLSGPRVYRDLISTPLTHCPQVLRVILYRSKKSSRSSTLELPET